MVYRPNEPYNDLPLLPPPCDLESVRVMRKCVTASRALAELKGAGNLIPNQTMYLQELERIGILTGEKRGRQVIYRHPALLEVLSA